MKPLRSIARVLLGVLCLGVLITGSLGTAQAGGHAMRPLQGPRHSVGDVHIGSTGLGRPFFAPPAFIDRSPPMSERPFAKPFIDQGPSIGYRPLAPIGGGTQVVPGFMP
ncbi:MAG: hypothetical protein ACREOH_11210 [Candidatus Entotheonellia bacterium]